MRCHLPLPQGETLKVLSFDSFTTMCAGKYKSASNESGRRGSNYDQCCVDCETGKAIRGGALKILPENVVLLDIGQRPDPRPVTSEAVYHENDRLPKISGTQLSQLTPSLLLTLWKNPPIKSGTKSTCPNCLRPDLSLACFGICSVCRCVAKGRAGLDLLQALDEKYVEIRILEGDQKTNSEKERQNESNLVRQPGLSRNNSGSSWSEPSSQKDEVILSSIDAGKTKIKNQMPDGACQGQGSGSQDDVGGCRIEMSLKDIAKEADEGIAVEIGKVCDGLKAFLLEKNRAYGNSAADPVRIFSKVDAIEQINVRIDDKLSRLARGTEYPGDDTELDLIGYLILKRAIKNRLAREQAAA